MDNPRYDFGLIDYIKADAIGEPGQRRFRIIVSVRNVSADLWLEKTQLFRLSVVIKQEIINIGYSEATYKAPSIENTSDLESEGLDSFEIDTGNINLFYIKEENLFSISVDGLENDTEAGTHLAFINSKGETIAYYVFGRSQNEYNICYVRANKSTDVYLLDTNIMYQLQIRPTFWGAKPEPEKLEEDDSLLIPKEVTAP